MSVTNDFRKYNKKIMSNIPLDFFLDKDGFSCVSPNSPLAGTEFYNTQGLKCEVVGIIDIGHEDNDISDTMYLVKYSGLTDYVAVVSENNIKLKRCRHPLYDTPDKVSSLTAKSIGLDEVLEYKEKSQKEVPVYLLKIEASMLKRKYIWKVCFGEPKRKYLEKIKLEHGMEFYTVTQMNN
jgi:hypothetical protein